MLLLLVNITGDIIDGAAPADDVAVVLVVLELMLMLLRLLLLLLLMMAGDCGCGGGGAAMVRYPWAAATGAAATTEVGVEATAAPDCRWPRSWLRSRVVSNCVGLSVDMLQWDKEIEKVSSCSISSK